jgi:hypothetical protein
MSKDRDLIRGEREQRDSRADDRRRLEERIAELNKVQNMAFGNPLDIPQEIIPWGWEYAWKRAFIRDEFDQGNWSDTMRRGWTTVPADRHPDYFFNKDVKIHNQFAGCIFYKGAILCERPRVFTENWVEKSKAWMRDQVEGLPALKTMMGDPTMPARPIVNETGWSQGNKKSTFG